MFSAKIDNGEWIHNIKSLSEISSDLLKFQIYNEDYINSLKNRIKNLEEDNFQDKTIQEALKEKDNAIAAMKNGFYILPEDKEKIDNWKRKESMNASSIHQIDVALLVDSILILLLLQVLESLKVANVVLARWPHGKTPEVLKENIKNF